MNNSETDISGQNDPTRTFRPLFGSNLGLHLDGETEDWPRARNGLNVNHSDWTCLAMDQLLGRETGRVFNDEVLAVAAGTKSPEQAAQAIENFWSQNRI